MRAPTTLSSGTTAPNIILPMLIGAGRSEFGEQPPLITSTGRLIAAPVKNGALPLRVPAILPFVLLMAAFAQMTGRHRMALPAARLSGTRPLQLFPLLRHQEVWPYAPVAVSVSP